MPSRKKPTEPKAGKTKGPSPSALLPEKIPPLVISLRQEKVLLDADLAELYGVETKVLNQAVKRNSERFPDDFMFQLSEKEWDEANALRSQSVTLKRGGHRKYLPYVFTEQGVAML